MKILILFAVTYFLLGCQSMPTKTEKKIENAKAAKTPSLQSNEKTAASSYKQEKNHANDAVMPIKISSTQKEYTPLALFKELSIDKISFNFKPQALLREDFVKTQILLTDTGSIKSINILTSSGNKQLESDVLKAIHQAAPLPLPNFTGEDLEYAKTLTISFPMDLR